MALLHHKRRKIAWAVVVILMVGTLAARGALTVDYTITECLGASDLSGSDQARAQTVIYNKPYAT